MKVTGSNITITDSVVNKMDILPLGNCEQTGIPTPDNPIDVKVVTGDNQVVVQNANLFNINDCAFSKENVTGTIGDDGSLILNGTSTNTIYVNFTNLKFSGATSWYYKCDAEGVLLHIGVVGGGSYNETCTTSFKRRNIQVAENTQYNGYIRIESGRTFNNSKLFIDVRNVDVQLADYSFIPHQEQSITLHLGSLELCKIGDYQDVITGSKDNWKVVRNVGHIVSYNGETITTDYISTTGELSTGAEVYYGLSISTEETITDTTLINELNGLQDMLSYDGTTNITITSDSDNAQMSVEVTYTSESDMNEKLTNIFNSIKSKLYHIIRAL